MARQRVSRRKRPATSPEMREMQLADAAYDLAEEQIESGTASSQVITHFLKAGSMRERLEQQRMQHEIELMEAKREHMESQKRVEALFGEALQAFRGYAGLPPGETVETIEG
jgi:stalled ribosome rescue protein Dom34